MKCFSGNCASVPKLLRTVRSEGSFSLTGDFGSLIGAIYHQNSCCEGTFATVPHLVDIAREFEPNAFELVTTIGDIAATWKPFRRKTSNAILESFKESIEEAELVCIKSLCDREWELYKAFYLAVAAFGTADHPIGLLCMDGYFPFKDAMSYAYCPHCDDIVKVIVSDMGLCSTPTVDGESIQPSQTLLPPPAFDSTTQKRSPNPWRKIGEELRSLLNTNNVRSDTISHLECAADIAEHGITSQTDIGLAFFLLGGILTLKGFPDKALRFFHANDTVTCRTCQKAFVFADNWWKLEDYRQYL